MKKIFVIICLLLCACSSSKYANEIPYIVDNFSDETPFTIGNWCLAVENRNEHRYELAYHYYSLALSSAVTENGILQIKSEMEALERIIQAAR